MKDSGTWLYNFYNPLLNLIRIQLKLIHCKGYDYDVRHTDIKLVKMRSFICRHVHLEPYNGMGSVY